MLFQEQTIPDFLFKEYEYFLRVYVRSMRVLQAINYHDLDNFATKFQKNLYHFFCKNIWDGVLTQNDILSYLAVEKLIQYFKEEPFLNQIENSEFRDRMIRLIEQDPYFKDLEKVTAIDRRRIARVEQKLLEVEV
jgi:uncharacterized protein YerC